MTIWYKLARNTASNTAGAAIPILVSLFLLPYIIKHIGAASYGIWILATSLTGYMGLINLGLGPTVTKKSAEYIALNDVTSLNRMLSTVFVIYLGMGVLVGVIVFFAGPFIPVLFQTESIHAQQLKYVIWIVGVQTALGFPFSIYVGLIQGLQAFHIRNAIIILNTFLRLIGTIILLSSGYGLISLIVLELAISLSGWVLQAFWVRSRVAALNIRLANFDYGQIRQIFTFSGAMLLWRMAALSAHRVNSIIIGVFMPLANITMYEIANKIVIYSRSAFMAFLGPLLPASSELAASNAVNQLKNIYLRSTKLVLGVYMAISISLFFWGDDFIILWMGKDYAQSILVMKILLIGNLFQAQNVVAHVMLPGIGRLRDFTYVMTAYPIVGVLTSIILTYLFGLIGAAISATLTFIILESYFLAKIINLFGISFTGLTRSCHVPCLVSIIPPSLFGFLTMGLGSIDTWVKFIGVCIIYFAIFGIAFWLLGISRTEKESIKSLYRSFVQKKDPLDTDPAGV